MEVGDETETWCIPRIEHSDWIGYRCGRFAPEASCGDSAPALNVMAWLKGEPVPRFEPGHVYVVDFWSTWCPVCAAAMPHLSAMQANYQGKLSIIGVNARETVFGVDTHNDEP